MTKSADGDKHANKGNDGDPADVFAALSDPTRQQLLAMLANEPQSASALARNVDVSRQAIAKHLSALEAVSLVRGTKLGRELQFHVDPTGLTSAADWIATTTQNWERRLDRLGELLDE